MIPVIPPDLRPLVPLDGGRFATSDLNDLYRRVINRNNRLKRLQELNAPEIIIRNEKRMLQEAVDALFDNGRRGKTITGPNKRPLKSLSDMLKGKQGRFRQNLLGKRVDYSGRSVIVVGPELKLHQCGLPKKMALELFKPFIYNKLEERGLVTTIKSAKKLVEKERPEVWDILEEVIKEHPILLNRAPDAAPPGHPGVRAAADRGQGDPAAPAGLRGVQRRLRRRPDGGARAAVAGSADGSARPDDVDQQHPQPRQRAPDHPALAGHRARPLLHDARALFAKGEYRRSDRQVKERRSRRSSMHGVFASPEEVRMAYDHGELDLQAAIRVRIDGELVPTTVGRVLLYEIVPKQLPFKIVNRVMGKKQLGDLIDICYRALRPEGDGAAGRQAAVAGVHLRDQGRYLDLRRRYDQIPRAQDRAARDAQKDVQEIEEQYTEGLITDGERYNKVVDIWAQVSEQIAEEMMSEIGSEELVNDETGRSARSPSFNPIYIMADSGARGSAQQIRQLAGMRGLMAKPSGEIIETPITTNFREGLSVLQYFISTHGARKGLADTALKTANSGYLTRRLVDVAQDCIIAEYDCGTWTASTWARWSKAARSSRSWVTASWVAWPLDDIFDPYTGEVLVQSGEEITEDKVRIIEDAGIDHVKIRSVLTCETRRGICVLCYGRDLARGHMVNIGEAVGVIAAQSIGEPGTQLTMRTFHIGGVGQVRTEQSQLEARYDGVVRLENTERGQARQELDRHEPSRRDRHPGRDRSRARAVRPDLRRRLFFGEGDARQGGQAPVGVGSVLGADFDRGARAW